MNENEEDDKEDDDIALNNEVVEETERHEEDHNVEEDADKEEVEEGHWPGEFELACQAADRISAMTVEVRYSIPSTNRFGARTRELMHFEKLDLYRLLAQDGVASSTMADELYREYIIKEFGDILDGYPTIKPRYIVLLCCFQSNCKMSAFRVKYSKSPQSLL